MFKDRKEADQTPLKIIIRLATPDDAAGIARVHVRSWQTAYRDIVHQSYLDAMDIGVRTKRWRENLDAGGPEKTFVAFDQENLTGFTTVGPSRDDRYPGYFEMWSIYVDPAYMGRGVGTWLFNRAIRHGIEQGFTRMFLNILADNKLGRQFYERRGGTAVRGSEFTAAIGDRPYTEMKYEWEELKL
jgi:ribosomal protein S18 acetylase RimI-like enzyme